MKMSKCSKNQDSACIGAVSHSSSTHWCLSLPLGIPIWVREMARTLKELAAKPEALSSILGTHMVEEQDQPRQVLASTYMSWHVWHVPMPLLPHKNINFTSLIWL